MFISWLFFYFLLAQKKGCGPVVDWCNSSTMHSTCTDLLTCICVRCMRRTWCLLLSKVLFCVNTRKGPGGVALAPLAVVSMCGWFYIQPKTCFDIVSVRTCVYIRVLVAWTINQQYNIYTIYVYNKYIHTEYIHMKVLPMTIPQAPHPFASFTPVWMQVSKRSREGQLGQKRFALGLSLWRRQAGRFLEGRFPHRKQCICAVVVACCCCCCCSCCCCCFLFCGCGCGCACWLWLSFSLRLRLWLQLWLRCLLWLLWFVVGGVAVAVQTFLLSIISIF